MWIKRGKRERAVCAPTLLCAGLRGKTQEEESERIMTQEGRGVKARKGGQKREQRAMVVLCGCARCRIRGCGLLHLISGIHTAFT